MIEPGYCQCGCGRKTGLARDTNTRIGYKKGDHLRYIHGHSSQFKKIPLAVRFMAKIEKTDNCWIWKGRRQKGYGYTTKDGVRIRAHRASWELFRGDIPKGLNVLHKCDNPSCVNPEHLFIGTDADNMADKISKGRQSRGAQTNRTNFNEHQILDIRKKHAEGIYQRDLALEYSVCVMTIGRIVRRESWNHL